MSGYSSLKSLQAVLFCDLIMVPRRLPRDFSCLVLGFVLVPPESVQFYELTPSFPKDYSEIFLVLL